MQYSPLIRQKAKRHRKLTQKEIERIFQRVIPMSASCQHRLAHQQNTHNASFVCTERELFSQMQPDPRIYQELQHRRKGIEIVHRKLPGYSIHKRLSGPNENLLGCSLISSSRASLF
jgi:hypothetical protein